MSKPDFECIFLELTNACNFDCSFCPNRDMTRKRGRMEPDLAFRLLDEMARKGLCRWVNLSLMGEPSLHPRFLDIARHGVEQGLAIHVITNYALLDDEKIRSLLAMPVANLTMSLQTPGPSTFGEKGASARFTWGESLARVAAVLRLKKELASPTRVEIHLLSTKLERPRGLRFLESTGERLAILSWLRKLAAQWARRFGAAPPPRAPWWEPLAVWAGQEGGIPLAPGVVAYFKRATLWANSLLVDGAEVEERSRGTCQLALDTLGILWNGDLTLCCLDYDGRLAFGDVRDCSLEEALAEERYLRLRRAFEEGQLPHPLCRHCRGRVIGPARKQLYSRSWSALAGEGLGYLRRFGLRKTLARVPQEFFRYFGGKDES